MSISPRWMKLFRDLKVTKGRLFMMVLALSVGVFAVGTILSAYTILTREISRNYLDTHPASAQIELDRVDESLVKAVQEHPDIAAAEAGSIINARIEINPGEWNPLLIFVIPDFDQNRINTFSHQSGAWPPPDGTMLLERESLSVISGNVGDRFTIQTPNGAKQKVLVSGLVHDPGLAPAWQEQTPYAYITPATLAKLEGSSTLHNLKIIVKDQIYDYASIERTTTALAGWLTQQGYSVDEIRIPPPGKHPHQNQMNAIMIMMLIFSLMTLVLSAILTATLIGALLAQQVRPIGIMKTVGARTKQIAGIYLTLVILVGLAAILLGIPAGVYAGRWLAGLMAGMLNFTIYSYSIPAWVFIVESLAGILAPLLIALIPILGASRITVREAINDYGISRKASASNSLDTWLSKLRGLDNTLLLALRNTFRRRSRLLLTLGLLSVAGGMFIASLNVKYAWEKNLKDATSERGYNLEIRLNSAESDEKVKNILGSIPGIQQVETWNFAPAAAARQDGWDIVRTYPDGGHGSFTLRSVPPGVSMERLTLLQGRFLQPGDKDAVLLNHAASVMFPSVKVGDPIQIKVNGRDNTYIVIGIVREILTPASAYVTESTFARVSGLSGLSNTFRLMMNTQEPNARAAISQNVELVLKKEKINVYRSVLDTKLAAAQSGHVYILIFSLIMMAFLMAVVGVLGLMSSMGSSVIERTREFGIMRTIGGKSRAIQRNIISEGIFIGLMSWVLAILISLPLSAYIGSLIGNIAFFFPLPLVLSPEAIGIWLVIIVFGAAGASLYPARRAASLTVRETLAYI